MRRQPHNVGVAPALSHPHGDVHSRSVGTAYTLGDVARICGVSRRRLRYWEQTALVQPSADGDLQPAFDFRDLVELRRDRLAHHIQSMVQTYTALRSDIPYSREGGGYQASGSGSSGGSEEQVDYGDIPF